MTGPLAILGPGVLGLSLAQWAAERGLAVRLLGRDAAHAARGRAEIERRWEAAVQRGRLDPGGRAAASARLEAHPFGPPALAGAGAFLEAVPEVREAKVPVLAAAAAWGAPDLLLLSGTSALPVADLAGDAGLQGRLLGFHLFVPVSRMAVVELVVPDATPGVWVDRARELAGALGKRAARVRDQAGFAAARMALAQGLEAMRLLEAGVAAAEDLDALMTLGYGHPVGPLELSDRVGLDLRLAIAEGIHRSTGDPLFEPPRLLREKVARGETGLRAGFGFYRWDASGRRA
ncbi:MAG TPA: 3-hydroxyacyl-CoA dehydrogenase family protein [Holophagaceae bacterium]